MRSKGWRILTNPTDCLLSLNSTENSTALSSLRRTRRRVHGGRDVVCAIFGHFFRGEGRSRCCLYHGKVGH